MSTPTPHLGRLRHRARLSAPVPVLSVLLVSLAATVLFAGCGSAPGRAPDRPVTQPDAASPAVVEVVRLLGSARVPADAVRRTDAPVPQLRAVPDSPVVRGTMTARNRYWVVPHPAAWTVRWLAAHRPRGLGAGAEGATGFGFSRGMSLNYTDYTPTPPPAGLAVAQLTMAIASVGPHRSAIAAYARALAQPERPAASRIPTHDIAVVAHWRLAAGGTPAIKQASGADAARLARAVDRLQVSVLGPHSCPMEAAVPLRLRFRAPAGRTWELTVTRCAPLSLRYAGGTVDLNPSARLTALVRRLVGWPPGPGALHGGVMTPLTRH